MSDVSDRCQTAVDHILTLLATKTCLSRHDWQINWLNDWLTEMGVGRLSCSWRSRPPTASANSRSGGGLWGRTWRWRPGEEEAHLSSSIVPLSSINQRNSQFFGRKFGEIQWRCELCLCPLLLSVDDLAPWAVAWLPRTSYGRFGRKFGQASVLLRFSNKTQISAIKSFRVWVKSVELSSPSCPSSYFPLSCKNHANATNIRRVALSRFRIIQSIIPNMHKFTSSERSNNNKNKCMSVNCSEIWL